MSKSKTQRLKDLGNHELVSRYKFQVRDTWTEKLHNRAAKNPGHDPMYQRELALQREILRRLEKKASAKKKG